MPLAVSSVQGLPARYYYIKRIEREREGEREAERQTGREQSIDEPIKPPTP